MRFYDPSFGHILIDGKPIQTLDLHWLRSQITLVQQQSLLFNETINQNIALGRCQCSTISADDVELACQFADLQDTINDLPEGINTVTGSAGISLSGGQRQRVAIARARLRDTPILILDESTSALDPKSRLLVMASIREWRESKTTIIITHDIEQIFDDDFVYVLENGQIVQQGYRNKLEEDGFGQFASFMTASSTTKSSQGFGVRSDSLLPPRVAVDHKYTVDTTPTNGVSNISDEKHHFPTFFGIKDHSTKESYTINRRLSRRMLAVMTTDIVAENIWKSPDSSATSSGTPLMLTKPPSTLQGLGIGPDPCMPSSVYAAHYPHQRDFSPKSQQDHNKTHKSTSSKALVQEFEMAQVAEEECTYMSTELSQSYQSKVKQRPIDKDSKCVQGSLHGDLLKNAEDVETYPTDEASMSAILSTVWPILGWHDRLVLALGVLTAFINAAATPAFSYVLARLLNTYYTPTKQMTEPRTWAISILGIAIIDGLSSFYFHWCFEYCGQVWIDSLRGQAMRRILAQPKSWFDRDENSPRALSEDLDRNIEEMRNMLGRFAGYAFVAASMMAIAIVWAFVVCWKLTMVGLASTPVVFIFTRLFETTAAKWERRSNTMAGRSAEIFTETITNIRIVRALTLEKYFESKHRKATIEAYDIGKKRAAYSGFFFGLSDSTNSFLTALVLYYGAILVGSERWSVGSVIQVVTLLLFSSSNAAAIMAFIPQISSSKATASRALHLTHLPLIASHEALGFLYITSPFPIRLHHLSFTYPSRPKTAVLNDLSLTIHAGSCTAIVGPSGSGKSTIASLLLGLYAPTPTPQHTSIPALSFQHLPASSINITSLRSTMALVSQTPALFPASIADNITYGVAEGSPLRQHTIYIEQAARAAGIHDFIAGLVEGYATRIGEGGQRLSGGQAQRIVIARALLRRPRLLVLDEATSALDAESAEGIRRVLRDLVARGRSEEDEGTGQYLRERDGDGSGPGIAVVMITHSVDMMRMADKIVVVEQGRVVQEGGFEELKRKDGPFRRLIRAI